MGEWETIAAFFRQTDEDGVTNEEKARTRAQVIRRVAETDSNKSYEAVNGPCTPSGGLPGVVAEDGRLIGFGIHIFNRDVYPLQSFEIYLRSCGLVGHLDLSPCKDLVFLDLYHNALASVCLGELPAMRILGLQDNRLTELDPTGLPACQGIDAGKNQLSRLDVSRNRELAELYINDNRFTEIDLRGNPKLKYFYCHNNRITRLDTTQNPLLRHMDATGNPMTSIRCLAPQQEEPRPLELTAGEGGTVGLKFNPVYNAQWKETGEWQQSYYAYPQDGWHFAGWYGEDGTVFSGEAVWFDTYGASRILKAKFQRIDG